MSRSSRSDSSVQDDEFSIGDIFSDELTQGIADLRDERISPRGGGSGEEAMCIVSVWLF